MKRASVRFASPRGDGRRATFRAAGAPIAIDVAADGSLAIEGEVATVAAKKLALGRAAALPDVVTIVDRLRVVPQRRLSDERIRRLLELLSEEPAFAGAGMRGFVREPAARPAPGPGIEFGVDQGVVTLDGCVGSLEIGV